MEYPAVIGIAIAASAVVGLRAAFALNGSKPEETPASASPGDLKATALDTERTTALLYHTGREVFFPRAPHKKPVYEVTVTGLLCTDYSFADARYTTDGSGNFTYRNERLRANGSTVSHHMSEVVEEDRLEHRYKFHIDGPEERLTLSLEKNEKWSGALKVVVRLLPPGTLSTADRRAAQIAQLEAKQARDNVSKDFAQQIEALCVRSQAFRNWADPTYRANFADIHGEDLIRSQSAIRDEALSFLAQRQIVQYLRRHHPEVVERYVGRLESLLIAERRSLEKRAEPAAPAAAPKKKLTAEEVRAFKVRKQKVAIDDRIALLFDRLDARLKIRERLEKMPLDEDEREMLEQELINEIEREDDEANTKTI